MAPPDDRTAGRRRQFIGLTLALLLGFVSGCGDTGRQSVTESASADAPTRTVAEGLAAQGRRVSFETSDGVLIRGLVFGTGTSGVVLSHMSRGGDSMDDWLAAADRLARAGRTVLIYSRRGNCAPEAGICSKGTDDPAESWRDVVAASHEVRRLGATTVVLGGASLGAMATFDAAARRAVDVDGLMWLGGVLEGDFTFDQEVATRLPSVPTLYLSSVDDSYEAGDAARRMHGWGPRGNRLVLVPGNLHGTDLVNADAPRKLRDRVVKEMDRLISRVESR